MLEKAEVIVPHPNQYRVDGEVGRFCFTTYDVKNADSQPIFSGFTMFPCCKGQQWYLTTGFKEVALLHGGLMKIPPI